MTEQAINALAEALDSERSALITNDAEGLMRANNAKLTALHVLESSEPPAESYERLRELMERNRANGALLARRQRELRWALRHLGRVDVQNDYNRNGRVGSYAKGRALGVG